jgi:hypothetical protein
MLGRRGEVLSRRVWVLRWSSLGVGWGLYCLLFYIGKFTIIRVQLINQFIINLKIFGNCNWETHQYEDIRSYMTVVEGIWRGHCIQLLSYTHHIQ